MNARRIRHKHESQGRNDEQVSGVFEIPAGSRVARRGSTRVEPSQVDVAPRGRGSHFSTET
jgi:hypothetical protein